MANNSDVLIELARQQEQAEASNEAGAKTAATIFNVLIEQGLTRNEALELTKNIVDNLFRGARQSDD